MTIEEHIENLKAIASDMPSDKCSDWIESLMAGVKALEKQPCDDAISRKKVIDTIYCECSGENLDIDFAKVLLLQRAIKALPSVTPQPKMGSSSENPNKCGKWRHYEGMLYCSKCGAEFYDEIMEYTGDEVPKYCPQCGQPKMQEVWNDN